VPDSPQNRAVFDGPSNGDGPGAFPQVQLLVHAECGTKALLNACFDGYRTGEQTLAGRLLGSFGPRMLVLADRNFLSFKLWRDAAATGADLLWRVRDSFTLPVLERLGDGSYLSRLKPLRKSYGDPITVRIIEYTVTTRDEHGATVSELFCLATTLLDPDRWPIEEFPTLYHDRWRVETMLDAVKTDLRGGTGVLTRAAGAGDPWHLDAAIRDEVKETAIVRMVRFVVQHVEVKRLAHPVMHHQRSFGGEPGIKFLRQRPIDGFRARPHVGLDVCGMRPAGQIRTG
jgi:hypothetical protein